MNRIRHAVAIVVGLTVLTWVISRELFKPKELWKDWIYWRNRR